MLIIFILVFKLMLLLYLWLSQRSCFRIPLDSQTSQVNRVHLSDKSSWSATFLFLLVFNGSLLFAAKWSPPRENAPTVKMGIVGTSLNLDIKDINGEAIPIQYRPNSLGRIAVGIEYLGFGAMVGTAPKAAQSNESQFGKTTGIDYQFRFLREQNSFDFFYQKYQGFYILNSKKIDPTIQGEDPYLQRSDIHTEHIGFQYYRTLSPENFSIAACFDQSGWQKENGGTWFYYSALSQHHIDSDYSIIPSSLISSYSSIQDFKKGDFTTAKLGFGGAYVWVYNKFFLAGKLIAAFGQQKQNYNLGTEEIDRWVPTSGGSAKISLGFNGDSYFTSFNLFNDSTDITMNDRQIQFGTLEISWLWGAHF